MLFLYMQKARVSIEIQKCRRFVHLLAIEVKLLGTSASTFTELLCLQHDTRSVGWLMLVRKETSSPKRLIMSIESLHEIEI